MLQRNTCSLHIDRKKTTQQCPIFFSQQMERVKMKRRKHMRIIHEGSQFLFFSCYFFHQECQSVWAEKLFVHTNTVNPSSLNVNVNNTIVRCTCHMHKIMQIDPFYFFFSLSFLSKCSLSHLNCISAMIIMKAHNTMNKSQSSLSNLCL